ncbi:hypothetical protein CIC12_12995 [Burkholderia sp. SG-MS1]|uniref:AAA family ATPase n=1 Tax=Paraburkholderia sp. SG-MS1 TaxID=2023741 RepID=UPI001445D034|nr:hypothetical protein [Paraburkholderia sp. SG-MS1]
MRSIKSLKLQNFRGFAGERTLDLDADLILVTGKNGAGKTSLLLAIDLLLNGQTSLIESTGDCKNTRASSGRLELFGKNPLQVDLVNLPARREYADLLERAQFFFPEGLVSPENSQDILSIVAPTAMAWQSIRGALEETQAELTTAKSAIFVQKFDVERERKTVALRFEEAKSKISSDEALVSPWVSVLHDSGSLLIQNGNLANYWQSQLKNLLDRLAHAMGMDTSASVGTDGVLNAIAGICEGLRSQIDLSKTDASRHAPADALSRELRGFDQEMEINLSEIFGDETHSKISSLNEIEKKFVESQARLSLIREQRKRLAINSDALAPSLEQMAGQAGDWLGLLRELPKALRDETVQLDSWLSELLIAAPELAARVRTIDEKLRKSELEMLTQATLAEADMEELRAKQTLRRCISPLKDEEWAYSASTIGELLERAEIRATVHQQTLSSLDRMAVALRELAAAALAWANLEREIERQNLVIGNKDRRVAAEKLVVEAERTLKRATGKDSIFSVTSAIDEGQVRELLRSLNRLLARFHFPPDFLPIQLQIVSKSAKVPNYRFVSERGPEYAGLSTGQKTQLAVCWTVCLGYALRDRITHPIVAFDDFTTALDLGQLIPASGILRQLAYCESDEFRRQVIVTSHHEDLTNRLLDYLLPPEGRTMKVIEMLEWTPENGPEMRMYDVKPSVLQASPDELAVWLNAQMQGRPA